MSSSPHVAWLRLSPRPGENVDVSSLSFVADLGIEGDRHANPDSRNQVLLMDTETLDVLELGPGDIRENVATTGIDSRRVERGRPAAHRRRGRGGDLPPVRAVLQDGHPASGPAGGNQGAPGHAGRRQRRRCGRCRRPDQPGAHHGVLTATAHPDAGAPRIPEVA